MTDKSLEGAIAEWLDTVAADAADTIEKKKTIVPSVQAADTAGRHAIAMLGELASGATRLRHIETLGQGGMGVVRLAEQVALGRRVAVKTLRADRKSEQAALDLLREAWVNGMLEHPNVVPVHDIGLDDDGSPVIVLKRVEGHAWSELIHDPERVRERFRAEDLLTWNLEILMQVLHGLRFAHSRGIVHRDLKPDNVMIGDFGEVYLLDWGIAVSLRDDGTGRLPLAKDATVLAGTPCYMAPEMLGGGTITERTDIYLAGAVLFEILAGRPPHDGDSAAEVIAMISASDPLYPEGAPAELEVICRRAMDADPDGRFENAEQVRLALKGYLQHAGSARLAAQAERRLGELVIAAARPDVADPVVRQELYKLFGAARFGFHEALAGWRGNAAAKDGLHRAVITMIEYELAHGDPRAASALLAEVDEPPAALAGKVAAAVRAKQAREAELEQLEHAHDARIGTRTRAFLSGLLGFLFTFFPIMGALHPDLQPASPGQVAVWSGAFLALIAGLGLWARESMTKTLFNRRVFAFVVGNFVLQIALAVGAKLGDYDAATIGVMMIFLWSAMSVASVVSIDRRLWPSTIGYLAAFFYAAHDPAQRHWAMAASNFVLTVNAVCIWRPDQWRPGKPAA